MDVRLLFLSRGNVAVFLFRRAGAGGEEERHSWAPLSSGLASAWEVGGGVSPWRERGRRRMLRRLRLPNASSRSHLRKTGLAQREGPGNPHLTPSVLGRLEPRSCLRWESALSSGSLLSSPAHPGVTALRIPEAGEAKRSPRQEEEKEAGDGRRDGAESTAFCTRGRRCRPAASPTALPRPPVVAFQSHAGGINQPTNERTNPVKKRDSRLALRSL